MSTSTANRPINGRINVHEPSDYPIILGESLKNGVSPSSQYLRFRYNWEPPRQGLAGQRGTLKRSNGSVQLAFTGDSSESQTYSYTASSKSEHNDEAESTTRFALVFDSTKSAYILEQISESLDFNLTSAHDQSREEVKQHKQINASRNEDHSNESNRDFVSATQDEEDPDAANPFDFRHFLSEAKENAEKTTLATGSRTPVPGSRTPLSVVSSPSLAAGRFHPTSTPQFRPTPTSAALPKRPPIVKSAGSLASKRQGPVKRKPAITKPSASQTLSSEIISSSSDDDTQGTITISQPSTTTAERGHSRNTSTLSAGRSPNIVVTSGDLEIDMGSPIHEPIRRAALDLDAFRSQTHTPTLPHSRNDSRRPPPFLHQDIEMPDRSEDEAEDVDDDEEDEPFEDIDKPVNMHEDEDEDVDIDVDELALGSPMPKKSDDRGDEVEKMPSPPTPSAPPTVDDDEDDFLAAELEKELGYEDESEVSEEE